MSDYIKDYIKNMTPDQVQAFVRTVMGPPRRVLEGKEREQVLLMLALMTLFEQSNSQHSWTNCYRAGKTEYNITSFPVEDDIVEEILNDADT